MPGHSMPVKEAGKIAERIAAEQGLELIDVELVKEPTGHFLRFFIDREGGVSLDELETFHRAILPLVENVAYDYMEVSSPGADRPLKRDEEFERAEGMKVELKTYRPVNGGKQFTGELVGLREGNIVLRLGEMQELSFPRKDVALVRPVIEFDEADLEDEAPAK